MQSWEKWSWAQFTGYFFVSAHSTFLCHCCQWQPSTGVDTRKCGASMMCVQGRISHVFSRIVFSSREYVSWRFLGGGWLVEFKHIKSIPLKLKREVKLAGDLQASLLHWGQVSELVYMQGCWPPNSSQHCGSWWIQIIQRHGEPASEKKSGPAAVWQLGAVVSQCRRIPNLAATLCMTSAWTWDCTVQCGSDWRRHSNHRTGASCDPDRARKAVL